MSVLTALLPFMDDDDDDDDGDLDGASVGFGVRNRDLLLYGKLYGIP